MNQTTDVDSSTTRGDQRDHQHDHLRDDDRGVIFVIGEVGLATPVNIGYATSLRAAEKRLQELSWANHRRLELLAVVPCEHARWVEYQLQVALAPWRISNQQMTEWFDVRPLITDDWNTLMSDVLAGRVSDAAELPGLGGDDHHRLLHVQGRPRQLRAVCSCGWMSQEGSATGACVKFDAHAGATSATGPVRRSA